MKLVSALILLMFTTISLGQAQDTTIRILGVYSTGTSPDPFQMTAQLQQLASSWNTTGLPSASATTVNLLNLAVAVPVNYTLPATADLAAQNAGSSPAIQSARNAWQADVIILFADYIDCGRTRSGWIDGTGNFVTNSAGLDLRYRNAAYVSVVSPMCDVTTAAHEFGHLSGGGHMTNQFGLYANARAWLTTYFIPGDPEIGMPPYTGALGTDIVDQSDTPYWISYMGWYSDGTASSTYNNKANLATTARSVANYYLYPPGPTVLNPPLNLWGVNPRCEQDITRYDLNWENDPNTNVEVTHYEIWKEQPLGASPIYGWTSYVPYSPVYVWGSTGRLTARACSGAACSARSTSYFDATPLACDW